MFNGKRIFPIYALCCPLRASEVVDALLLLCAVPNVSSHSLTQFSAHWNLSLLFLHRFSAQVSTEWSSSDRRHRGALWCSVSTQERSRGASCSVCSLFMADKLSEWCLPWLGTCQVKYPACTSQLTQLCASLLGVCNILSSILKKNLLRIWWKSKWFRASWWIQGLVYNCMAKLPRSFCSSAVGV